MADRPDAGAGAPRGRARSFLFIPAHSTRMLAKIDMLRPDAFIADLEDGVPPAEKRQARDNVRTIMSEGDAASRPPVYVRVNDLESGLWLDDIRAAAGAPIAGFVIPKFESFLRLADVERELSALEGPTERGAGGVKLILQLESMRGFRELLTASDAPASGRLVGLALGAEDFAASLSTFSAVDPDMIDFARKLLVLNARSLGVLAIDTIHADVRDLAGLRTESARVARMGFDGKLAIHPSQVEVINDCLSPSPDDIARARRVLEHAPEIEERGAISVDGLMFDRAHLNWAQKVQRYWPEGFRKD